MSEATSRKPADGDETPARGHASTATASVNYPAGTTPKAADDNKNDDKPKATGDPLQGAKGDPNRVPSATGDVSVRSLATMANLDPDALESTTHQADQTEVVMIGEHEAAKTPANATGAFGMQLPPGGEVAGGNIAKVLDPPIDASLANNPLTKERAALLSPVGRALGGQIGRPPAEWGLLGPGDAVKGHMLLLDLHTGEKLRAMDGHRIGDGKLYANLRNFPESLATGDTIDLLLGSVK